MRRVFVSYHHANEQYLRARLTTINLLHQIFIDCSVDTGDIDDSLSPQDIRQRIRRNYLSESTVTLLLVGTETKYRKHVDWELYSSMYNGSRFGKSGVVVILAPNCESFYYEAPFQEIKSSVYPYTDNWVTIDNRAEYERRFPHLPSRIIDCLMGLNSNISVTNWSVIENNPEVLRLLIELAHQNRGFANYDLSDPMKMRDHYPLGRPFSV